MESRTSPLGTRQDLHQKRSSRQHGKSPLAAARYAVAIALVSTGLLPAPTGCQPQPDLQSLQGAVQKTQGSLSGALDAAVLQQSWPSVQSGIGTGSRQGLRPLMGWSSYNAFKLGVNESIVRRAAHELVVRGLARLGYRYVAIDDGWQAKHRDAHGNLQPNPERYPGGMKALGDLIHQCGLKFGIYSDSGYRTCLLYPGSLNHEFQDAKTFASWGVDYLKYDNCNTDRSKIQTRYLKMRAAVNATGRDIHFNMCEWGWEDPATWARRVGDSWRTTRDIKDLWAVMLQHAVINNQWASYAGPGGWNDLDALEVGNGGMKINEYRVHFTLWAIMKSPLFLGNDLSKMNAQTQQIVSNREVIAINQDSIGIQARIVNHTRYSNVWAGPLAGGRVVVALVNIARQHLTISANWQTLKLRMPGVYHVRDVWQGVTERNVFIGSLRRSVPSHDVALFVLIPSVP